VVGIDRGTRLVLEKHRLAQAADRELAGPEWHVSDLVFTSQLGRPLFPDTLTQLMAKLIEAHNSPTTPARRSHPAEPLPRPEHQLPPIRLHDLRHLNATLFPRGRTRTRRGEPPRTLRPCSDPPGTPMSFGSPPQVSRTSLRGRSSGGLLANLLANRPLETMKPAGQGSDLRVCGGQGRGRTADLPIFRHTHTCRPEDCQAIPCDNSCDNGASMGPWQLGRVAVQGEV
jgi:hypothetical protein